MLPATGDAQQAALALLSATLTTNNPSLSLSSTVPAGISSSSFSSNLSSISSSSGGIQQSSQSSLSSSSSSLSTPMVPPVVPLITVPTVLPRNPLLSTSIANLPSNLTHLIAPGNVNVQIGTNPAHTAGLLGPGGLPSLLATVQPTRILVLINMLTDNDYIVPKNNKLSSSSTTGTTTTVGIPPTTTTYSFDIEDIVNDVTIEAQSILNLANTALQHQQQQLLAMTNPSSSALLPSSIGHLIRIVCPLPKLGETIEPKHIVRPTQLNIVGATGLLEDSQQKKSSTVDNSQALTIPTTREEFYKKSLAQNGINVSSTILQNRHHANPYDNTDHLPVDRYHGSRSHSPERETNEDKANTELSDLKPEDRTKGLGKLFLEFDTVNAAVLVQKELSGKFFNGHIVLSSFVDEYKFNQGEYASLQPCKRIEGSSKDMDMDTGDENNKFTLSGSSSTEEEIPNHFHGIEIGSGSIILTGPPKK